MYVYVHLFMYVCMYVGIYVPAAQGRKEAMEIYARNLEHVHCGLDAHLDCSSSGIEAS